MCSAANDSVVKDSEERQYSHRRFARCSTAWRRLLEMYSDYGRSFQAELFHQARYGNLPKLREFRQRFQAFDIEGFGFIAESNQFTLLVRREREGAAFGLQFDEPLREPCPLFPRNTLEQFRLPLRHRRHFALRQ